MKAEPRRSRKPRVPQAERRADVIDAALIEFGRRGYDGTTTSMIADRAGIQQPYIYALFENKRHLFLACQETMYERMLDVFEKAIDDGDSPYERLRKMGIAYIGLLNDEQWLHCHLQVLAASGHPELKEPIRESFESTFRRIGEITGAEPRDVAQFFATGTLLNAMFSLGCSNELLGHLRVPREDEL
ncbi:MAG: TetR/AcrR family transcriptional regulator [Actinomycetota bacterium]|nr:TetR/AcrR family transcriptional regulator [Actinomycetota bacterium]